MSKTRPTLFDLTPEQASRLIKFKDENGRCWKQTLNDMWLCGEDARQSDGHLLRQIRNQQGPTWLHNLKF